jgi:hypothetical protein
MFMRIKRLFATTVLVGAALVSFAAPVVSAQPNCLGTFASGNAGPGFGTFAAAAAREARPLGRNFVGPAASSDDCSQIPNP